MKVNILSIIIKQISSTTVKERTKNITPKKKKKKNRRPTVSQKSINKPEPPE